VAEVREVAPYDKGSREEEAELSLKRTDVTRPLAWVLCLGFLATICTEGVIQHVVELRRNVAARAQEAAAGRAVTHPLLPQAYKVVTLLPSWRDIKNAAGFSGYWNLLPPVPRIAAFEKSLEENSKIARFLQRHVQLLLVRAGAGNEKAYVGLNHWLFYRPEIDYLTGAAFLNPRILRARERSGSEAVQPDPRKAILQFHSQLAQRGISLIVMPLPSKAVIQPEMFSPRYAQFSQPLQNPSFEAFKKDLSGQGVLVFDPSAALVERKLREQQPQFLETDTHWRPEAMEFIAGRLKDFILRNVKLPEESRPAGYTQATEQITALGDLAVLLRLPDGQDIFARQAVPIHPVLTARKEFWQPNPRADVLLLGDSYTNIFSLESMSWGYDAGLAEQLSRQLQRPVDRIARNDTGSFVTRQMLAAELAKGRDRLAGKRVVIWEFAVRELAIGDWKLLDLKTPGEIAALAQTPAANAQFLAVSPGQPVVVTGVIESISPAPRPGSVPYKDHILSVHLTELRGVDAPLAANQALVYMWSMRDNKSTPAAKYRAGDKLRLKLTNWNSVASRYEALNRSDLDNAELQLREPNWGEIDE
jgi:alginate O-acetyltransferase complex protein AlgJ